LETGLRNENTCESINGRPTKSTSYHFNLSIFTASMFKLAPCLAAVVLGTTPGVALLSPNPIVAQSASQALLSQAPPQANLTQANLSVGNIARQVTVRIEGQNTGSGVVIARQGQTYQVLTAKHVVATEDEYDIITPDGKKHRIDYKLVRKLPGVDLALVQFSSPQTYAVATLGRSHQLSTGNPAYVAGFPIKELGTSNTDYRFSEGEIAVQSSKPLANGYALAYMNNTFSGMSGGPVFNRQGQVVGIHGASKLIGVLSNNRTETGGIDADTGKKIGLNLAIPIDTFLRLAPQVAPSLTFAAIPAAPAQPAQPTAADLFIQAIEQEAAGDLSGKPSSALTLLNEVIRLQPNFALAYFQRGNVNTTIADLGSLVNQPQLTAKYTPRAIADYTEAIRLNPNFSAAYNNRGLLRRGLGDLQGAIADYTAAIRLNPKFDSPYNNRGLARYLLKDLQAALTDLNEAIRLNPNSANTYLSRGAVRNDLGDLSGAIADLDQSIRLSPRAKAYYFRGQVQAKSNNVAKAMTDYGEAIRLDPKFYQAYNNRGLLRTEAQEYPGAIADFTETIRLRPSSAGAYLNRGLAHEKAGARKEAAADFQKAAELAAAQGDNRLQQMALNSLKRVQ
jgi:tetratricopeptide (TPR) repeat protein/S1-C subfamily serine protease